ncbi:MAG: hypothetical protein H6581_23170 [Bacteroidia bacterium]|nr:hypothetical protein [Bacteroidia bacterium]
MNIWLRNILIFAVLLLFQVLVFDHFSLFGVATAHIFLAFLLMLPLSLRFPILILIAFGAGLLVDIFSTNQAQGIQAFSCVLMMSLRNFWVEIVTTRQAFKGNEESFLRFQPVQWYVSYLAPLILVHQITFYLLEAFSLQHFGLTLLKIIFSSLFTFSLVLGTTMVIYNQSARK